MPSRTESSAEVFFRPTRDGLLVSRVLLRPLNAEAEKDLRKFYERVVHDLKVMVCVEPPFGAER